MISKKMLFSPDMKVHTKSGENNLFSINPAYTIFIEIKYSIQTLHFIQKQKWICYLIVAMEKNVQLKVKTNWSIHVILANLGAMHVTVTLSQFCSTHVFSLLFSLQYLRTRKIVKSDLAETVWEQWKKHKCVLTCTHWPRDYLGT